MSMPRDDGLGLFRGMAWLPSLACPSVCALFYCLGAVAGALIMLAAALGCLWMLCNGLRRTEDSRVPSAPGATTTKDV